MCGVFGAVLPEGGATDAASIAALGPVRAAASRPGIGRAGGQRRRAADALQGPRDDQHGPRRAPASRACAAASPSPTAATPRPGRRSGRTPSRRTGSDRAGRWRSATTATSSTRASCSASSRAAATRLPASTDTELLTALLADEPAADTVDALIKVLPRVRGAFSLVVLDEKRVIGIRDPHGFRPLVLGRLPGHGLGAVARTTACGAATTRPSGWCLSSETAGLDIVGAEYVRDVQPGELVILEPGQAPRSVRYAEANPALCVFELIYFARPDSYMEGRNLYEVRRRMGMQLAGEHAVDADLVMPVPDTGRAGGRRVRRGVRPAVSRGHVPQPLCRADVHPAVGRAAPPGRDDQAQPAARGRERQAPHRRRRLDRARDDDEADRGPAAQGRGRRGPRPDQRAADLPPVLLRHRYVRRDRADRRDPHRARDPRVHRGGHRSATCRSAASSRPWSCRTSGSASPASTATTRSPSRTTSTRASSSSKSRWSRVADGRAAASRGAYRAAGVDVAAGERAVELMRDHVASTARPEVVGGLGGFGGAFGDPGRLPRAAAHRLERRRRHEDGHRRARRPIRHDRHRPRRDVRRRRRLRRRGAARVPRLHRGRPPGPAGGRGARRRGRRGLPGGGLRARRRRDGRASRA